MTQEVPTMNDTPLIFNPYQVLDSYLTSLVEATAAVRDILDLDALYDEFNEKADDDEEAAFVRELIAVTIDLIGSLDIVFGR